MNPEKITEEVISKTENTEKKTFPLKAIATQEGNLHCTYLLGELKRESLNKLYRYIPAERLLKDIRNKDLVFVSPTLWEDPFERKFVTADFSRYKYQLPEFVCLCFTDDCYEAAAAGWRMYSSGGSGTMVRVEYDVKDLLEQLDKYCEDNNLKLYISKVSYGLSKKDLRDEPVKSILGEDVRNELLNKKCKFSEAHLFSLLSVKRKAFSFESEIRFFIVGDKLSTLRDDVLLHIQIELRGIINKVMIEPVDPKCLDLSERKEYNRFKSEKDNTYKKKFNNVGIRVVGSSLYSETPVGELIK